jgi:hypothetical protein
MLLLLSDVEKVALESLATGSIAMTLARSRMFREVRWWIHRHWGDMAFDLSKCPWCLSHWLAFGLVALWQPIRATNWWVVDWIVNSFVVVALAPIAAFFIHRVYGALPPVPTEAEWNEGEEVSQ